MAGEETPALDEEAPPIEVKGLVSRFGDTVIHDGLNLKVKRGEVLGVVGGSGAGKSVLLNTLIGLKQPDGAKFACSAATWRRRPAASGTL